ncbi:beta strand repeat-containing protein [Rivibacter subsaxonicus]|uniref:Putative repeat protein (TIGR01451 family) n=1 Tax=Rivibacter subsaxonicus TaxID=457575 RepID=A0A4Q7W0H4_9BURK|nr:DUF11 domain-containing protein [Rivibacter subsaxonicus]RZU02315.1 putative repeat protein (TIGR01451 family) [Rivibacter subsaxonicus]
MSTTAIRSTGAPRWMTAALGLLTALFLWAALMPNALAAPPAGTVIGNQATATFVDAGGTSRNTLSNLVQTTVSQVKSFTLTANGARTGAAGQTVYYPHTITNTGNGADTYALNAPTAAGGFTHTGLAYYADANGDGVPDNLTAITSSGPLAAGTQFRFVVGAVIPAGASNGQTGTVTVNVADTGSNTATNTDTTTVANSAVNVTKALSVGSGPSPSAASITVTLTYTNSGTAAAADLTLTDVLPAGMNYVTGSGLWSGSGTALTDATGGDPSGITYSYTAAGSGTIAAVITSVPAGSTGTVSFRINIASGLAPSTLTNLASFSTTTQASANTNPATYVVAATASVTATGPAAVPSAPQGGTLTFSNVITNTGNASDSFDITYPAAGSAGNNFPVGTSFALLQADGVTTLLDTNGNGTPDTGPLAAGASYTVVLRATLPAGATGGPFTVTKTATSRTDSTKSATANDTLTAVVAATMDLTQNTARSDSTPAGTAAAGNTATTGFGPGTASVIATNTVTPNPSSSVTTTFSLVVNNTTTASDSYTLSATGLPTGWSAAFYNAGGASCSTLGSATSNTGALAGGTNKLVCAVVTVPAISTGNAAPGTSNLTFRATSALSASVFDSIVDAVIVNTVRNISLTPNGAQQAALGGSVTYTHDLANLGNSGEGISFASGFLSDSLTASGWTSTAYFDANNNGVLEIGTDPLITTSYTYTLPVGQTRQIFVRVFAPGSLTADNISTLTATYTLGSVSVTDRTSVSNGLLLSKAQVAGTCAAALASGPFSTADIVAGPNTAPGRCVAYQISATNTSASTITAVALSDTVPPNTTLAATSCAAPTATGGATLGGTLTEGATGTLTASLASLASGASFQFTFCVRINP